MMHIQNYSQLHSLYNSLLPDTQALLDYRDAAHGSNLLMFAAWYEDIDLIEQLLQHGFDPYSTNHQGYNAFMVADSVEALEALWRHIDLHNFVAYLAQQDHILHFDFLPACISHLKKYLLLLPTESLLQMKSVLQHSDEEHQLYKLQVLENL